MSTSSNISQDTYKRNALKMMDFIAASPSPFHAVAQIKSTLEAAGFQQISEKDSWEGGVLKPGGKYYFTRNQSTAVAFVVGGKYQPGNGFLLVGAHTDSPSLVVKPNYAVESEGYHQIGVEPYGGGLWTTWFDRDLTLAGRVIVKEGNTYTSKLMHVKNPIIRIPMLAVHLDRDTSSSLTVNKQDHILPILATEVQQQLVKQEDSKSKKPSILKSIIAKELGCEESDIRDFELFVADTQPPALGGVYEEFVYSPRLDNLQMTFCSLQALTAATSDKEALANEANILGVMLFDNEEIGSATAHGADSPITQELVERVLGTFTKEVPSADLLSRTIRRSFLISADMAHAVHPNYKSKHEENHKPYIHKGPVIKRNALGRYATTAETAFFIREIAAKQNIPLQDFVVRNDVLCGSTIGPIISHKTGIRTVDIGNPQLSMHSIRETCGTTDITHAINLFTGFFQTFTELDKVSYE